MVEFFTILKDIILPIFIIMAVGYICQIKFNLNVQTLARMNIYFFVPGFIFVRLYETTIDWNLFFKIISFILVYILILYIVAAIVAKFMQMKRGEATIFSNSIMFFNSGNYGVPANDLAFKSDPFAASIQVIFLMFQNIFLFTYGIFSLQAAQTGKLKALLSYFKMPVMYALFLGIILGSFHVPIPNFIWIPANYVADGLIAIALFTLGAQVANIKVASSMKLVYVSLFLRLLIGPFIALGMIYLFGLNGITAQAILIASTMPTSVNSAVIAEEYKNHPDIAAQMVLFSTLFSSVTVTFFIYLARILF